MPVSDADLERMYAYPDSPHRPWVQVNFVASADGAVSVDDRSGGLSHPADQRIFGLARDLADLVLVGAGTAITEKYRGARATPTRLARSQRSGLADVPPIAVVSGRCSITPDTPLFTDTTMPPIIITTSTAPDDRVAAVVNAGAEVIVAGEYSVDLTAVLIQLHERGLSRIDCEGGPHLFGTLIAEDLVDQLCLTVSPFLAGAGANRIAEGRHSPAGRNLELASVLHEDGFTMLRYRRHRGSNDRTNA